MTDDPPSTPHAFDEHYWEKHWEQAPRPTSASPRAADPNPHLVRETAGLVPGSALDAGCGEGGEALWLASLGWQVTAADISADALSRAADTASALVAEDRIPRSVRWLHADLTTWEPSTEFDLVTTNYAHPTMPQLAFYARISEWVAPGGTLLIVGHLHGARDEDGHGHDHGYEDDPPAEASVSLSGITAGLASSSWEIVTAQEHERTLRSTGGHSVVLHDVVVRATRRL